MLNRVILIGRLTKDPELRYTPAGVAVTQFTLAVDRPFTSQGGEREADFIPVVTWRQLAETCANYLRKGRLTAVEGRIQVRNYENNEGKRVYVTEVIADNVRFLESNRDGGGSGGSSREESSNNSNNSGGGNNRSNYNSNNGNNNSRDNQDPFSDDGKPIDISDDDLPF
ncbi:single-stranded DNA-binding protein [Paenibacillus sp. PsM32]|uniref:Single-stranded DNA-binding protein n=1 Tax=Paenibacillus kyungheensis TaxID=1452732 RepID=A0AAX3M1H4_9BACL|nr:MULTISPECIES: single-stranded DNA-binding protein [Paenibacillus]MDN4618462.1 single-stranded DNA-binding protein [Paenibacillus sp. PsM32]MDQ1236521.1 single-strand DNA-binding protein [Paenibacillus sp. SORGH_AS_0306]MDR6108877.1 single-strand DNA-binding protein [Paenibacillus sp. SORGH_AS_0338]WCT55947.1 single-stranded DNA-binding protein [Paenibacillus kyungheensis]WDF50892.1 single-stranded DNA-binding protein [Paenibacillus sp. KACC 21273]